MADAIAGALAERCNADDDDPRASCSPVRASGPSAPASDIGELDDYATPWAFRNRAGLLRRDARPAEAHRSPPSTATPSAAGWRSRCSATSGSPRRTRGSPRPRSSSAGSAAAAWPTLLAQSIGPSNAALMMMTGDPIDGRAALAWGLVSEVVPQAELLPRARALARDDRRAARRSRPRRRRPTCARRTRCRSRRRSLRARPADDLLRHRGRRRGPGGLSRRSVRRCSAGDERFAVRLAAGGVRLAG